MEKVGNPIQLRLPGDLERALRDLAGREYRSLTAEIIYLLYLGVHVVNFSPGIVDDPNKDSQE